MIFRNYPIMMGLGTKILTSYHHPSFRSGLMVAILDSKKVNKKGQQLSEEEFRKCASKIRCEMYFDCLEALNRYIFNLERLRDIWADEISDSKH